MNNMLPKTYRLKNQNDFIKLAKSGRYFFIKEFTLKWLNNNLDYSRFGVVVSTKVDKRAVWRNKIKRRIHEILHHQLKKIKPGFDILIITRPEIKNLEFQELKSLVEKIIKKAGIL